jgi:uncharacterized membrane protein
MARVLTATLAVATLTYYMDSANGRRRRARFTERSADAARDLVLGAGRAGRDLAHRLAGMPARTRGLFRSSTVQSTVLVARVRACLRRSISHPGAVHVSLAGPQRVLLRGAVLAWEYQPLLRAVAEVPGVRAVHEQLAVHESAEHLSSWQRPRLIRALRPRPSFPPGARLATAAAGGSLVYGGLLRRGKWGWLSATVGTVLVLRSLWNRTQGSATLTRDRMLTVRRSLHIRSPLPQVFAVLCDCESFPRWMRGVRAVRRHEDGSTSWRVAGPIGPPMEWSAIATQIDKDRLIAWRTLEGSPLQHSGLVCFEAEDGGTRLQIDLWYRPPGGGLNRAIAGALRTDSQGEFDADLARLKTHLESGSPRP